MSGHVFHPGHEELHGVTVVVTDRAGKAFVGRYHERGPRGILLHDVAIHDPADSAYSRDEWLNRQKKFGVQVSKKSVVIPDETTDTLRRLFDI